MPSQSFKVSYLSGMDSGKVTWRSPSNIALVKYWGKRERQLPANPSLSITLSNAYTETTIDYEFIEALSAPGLHFMFNGINEPVFEKRIALYIQNLILDIPCLKHLRLNIQSKNTFPHSAGIASSASAFSSIALCLCSIEEKITGQQVSGSLDLYHKASYLARLGSGSACRSVFGGYVIWGNTEESDTCSNLYAQPFPFEVHPELKEMHDTILIVSSAKKEVSSSIGHGLMKSHPYAEARYDQARKHTSQLIEAIRNGDMEKFIEITENEALSLHGLLMSSEGQHILLKPQSLAIIDLVRIFRNDTKIPVCFSIDAGPNIHLLYPKTYREKVCDFITQQLLPLCENGKMIDDKIGIGPLKINV